MARWTESACLAGKHKQALFPTLGTPDAGKPAHRIAAVKVFLYHFLDDGTEEPVLLLEAALIFSQELVKVMEHYLVEHGAFRMTGTVNSCHSKELSIKKRARPRRKGIMAEMKGVSRRSPAACSSELSTSVDAYEEEE